MVSLLEFDALTTPTLATSPKQVISDNGENFFDKIDPVTGHIINPNTGESTLVTDRNGLVVDATKNVHFVIRAGMVNNDLAYVERGLLAIETLLTYQDQVTPDAGTYTVLPDGAFPAHKRGSSKKTYGLHNKTIVCERHARTMLMLMDSPLYTGTIVTRVEGIISNLNRFANFLVTYPDHLDVFTYENGAGNQHISNVAFLQYMSQLSGVTAYADKAREIIEILQTDITAAARITSDGIVTEQKHFDGIGLDGQYNSFSLETLLGYWMYIEAGTWKDAVYDIIEAVAGKEISLVTAGEIDDTGWTRTIEQPPRDPNNTSWSFAAIPNRFHMAWYLSEGAIGTETLQDECFAVGQEFVHINRLTSPEEDEVEDTAGIVPRPVLIQTLLKNTIIHPQSLGTDLYAWWDGSRSDLITEAANAVSSWRDVVGAYNVVQAVGAAQPLRRGVWIYGDGVDDELTLAPVPAGIPIGATPCEEWFLVDQQSAPSDTTSRVFAGIGGATSTTSRRPTRVVVSGQNRIRNVDTNVSSTESSIDFSGRCIIRLICTGTTISVEINGVESQATSVVSAIANARITFFASNASPPTAFALCGIAHRFITAPNTRSRAAGLFAFLQSKKHL